MDFMFVLNIKSMNLRIHELVIFNKTTKIDTNVEFQRGKRLKVVKNPYLIRTVSKNFMQLYKYDL
jgi:hypothetical protein